jgi:hypothetical protein
MDAWLQVGFLTCALILLTLGIAMLVRWVDARKPKQMDWVAHKHREIRKAGERTRIGAR